MLCCNPFDQDPIGGYASHPWLYRTGATTDIISRCRHGRIRILPRLKASAAVDLYCSLCPAHGDTKRHIQALGIKVPHGDIDCGKADV